MHAQGAIQADRSRAPPGSRPVSVKPALHPHHASTLHPANDLHVPATSGEHNLQENQSPLRAGWRTMLLSTRPTMKSAQPGAVEKTDPVQIHRRPADKYAAHLSRHFVVQRDVCSWEKILAVGRNSRV